MSIVETALIFVGIPLAVVLLLAAAVYGGSEIRQPNRYRPGRPWNYPPVWYLPHLLSAGEIASTRPAIAGSVAPALAAEGGASGEW